MVRGEREWEGGESGVMRGDEAMEEGSEQSIEPEREWLAGWWVGGRVSKYIIRNEIQGLAPPGIGDRRAVAVCKRAGVGCRVCRACGVTVMTDDALILMCVECAAVSRQYRVYSQRDSSVLLVVSRWSQIARKVKASGWSPPLRTMAAFVSSVQMPVVRGGAQLDLFTAGGRCVA